LLAVPGTTEPSSRWRQRGAVALRCGEKSSHQKTKLDVGMVKSAVADPAVVLAAYVSKMWSQARNSLALDGVEGTDSADALNRHDGTGPQRRAEQRRIFQKVSPPLSRRACGRINKARAELRDGARV
jgi:hypothetical protein